MKDLIVSLEKGFSSKENCHNYRKARRLRKEEMRFATPQLAKYSLPRYSNGKFKL